MKHRKMIGVGIFLLPVFAFAFENDFISAPRPAPTTRIRRVVPRPAAPAAGNFVPGNPAAATPPATSNPSVAAPAAVAPAPVARPRTAAPVARPRPARSSEAEVDLSSLDDSPSSASSAPAGRSFHSSSADAAAGGSLHPNFKFYFDFMFRTRTPTKDQPGATPKNNSFDSFHQIFMVEYTPTPEFTFMAEIRSDPRFYEVAYQISPRVQVRWGRIWIPLDDLSPHNIFGGRVNTSLLAYDSSLLLLPDLWADLGVAMKYRVMDSTTHSMDFHAYAVNGFRQTTTDPTGLGAPRYPDFSSVGGGNGLGDNNSQKDFGGRLQYKYKQSFGIGASYYKGTYTDKKLPTGITEPATLGLSILGADVQFRPTNMTEIRAGYVTMNVDLEPTLAKPVAKRGGTYLELGQKFGADRTWKALIRTGQVQADDRASTVGDLSLVGITLLKMVGPLQFSVEYNKDSKQAPGKTNMTYGAFRIVTAL